VKWGDIEVLGGGGSVDAEIEEINWRPKWGKCSRVGCLFTMVEEVEDRPEDWSESPLERENLVGENRRNKN